MSKLKEAAQAAVEAFDLHGYSPLTIRAIWALRDALAEPGEDGWRRCAESQGETQHCGLLEAAVLAEREACAKLVWATPEPDDVAISHREAIVKAIRARGQE